MNRALLGLAVLGYGFLPVKVVNAQSGFETTRGTIVETQKILVPTAPTLAQTIQTTDASTELQDRTKILKDSRKQEEKVTEALIQEKLESSRLEDERKRAQKLFGGSALASGAATQSEEKQIIELKPTTEPKKAESQLEVTIEKHTTVTPDLDIESLKNELKQDAASGSVSTKIESSDERTFADKTAYIGGLIGGAGYPELYNVDGDVSAGVVAGARVAPQVYVEGSFLYSRYYLSQNYWNSLYGYWERINQYNIQLAVKYALMESRFTPTIGGALSYTRRTYSLPDPFGQFDDNGSSTSFDFGLVVGLDFMLSKNVAIGADFRYMINLTASEESEFLSRQYRASGVQSIEESDYFILGGNIKLLF